MKITGNSDQLDVCVNVTDLQKLADENICVSKGIYVQRLKIALEDNRVVLRGEVKHEGARIRAGDVAKTIFSDCCEGVDNHITVMSYSSVLP